MAELIADESTDPRVSEVSLPAEDSLPRLRLHHLFALTAVMSVFLGLSGPQYDFDSPDGSVPQWMRATLMLWGVLYSILASTAVTAVAYGIAWQRKGIRFFDQPGHWLMVEIAVSTLLGLLPYSLVRAAIAMGAESVMSFGITMLFISLGTVLFRLVLNIYFGIKKCTERRWSWVFYLKAFAAVVHIVGDLIVLAMISRASLIDRRQGMRRDWGHCCGVAVQIGLMSLTGFLTIFFMLSFAFGWWGIG